MRPSARQLEALILCARGLTQRQIGEVMFIATATVERHCDDLRKRIGARTMPQAVMICVARGYVAVDEDESISIVDEDLLSVA